VDLITPSIKYAYCRRNSDLECSGGCGGFGESAVCSFYRHGLIDAVLILGQFWVIYEHVEGTEGVEVVFRGHSVGNGMLLHASP
jgi:hypothetical protein